MALITRQHVLEDPWSVAEHLAQPGCIFGLTGIEVRVRQHNMVVFWITFEPWAPMAARGYPTERVSVTVWPGGRVTAVPISPGGRTWYHIYPYRLGQLDMLGELCLWFPDDPRALRWDWEDGFVSYITIVHRHLQAEEYYRRNGRWPSEDAPHGRGNHPIRTLEMRQIAERGAA